MKTQHTPQLSLRDSARFATNFLPSFLPSAKVFLSILLTGITTLLVNAQPPLPPTNHGTLGRLEEPQLYQYNSDGAFWSYQFTEDVNGCAKSITFLTYATIVPITLEGTLQNPITVSYYNNELSDDQDVMISQIRELAQIGNQAFYLTNISMRVVINGTLSDVEIYPGQSTKISTGLAAPCDCLFIFFDWKNHRITTSFGGC